LQEYKRAGIYHFVGQDGEDYVGSSSDLETRLNQQHRVRGLNPNQSYRHPSFYTKVVDHGWEHFNLHILTTIDLPSTNFAQLYPDSLNLEVTDPLLRLDKYVITLVEQSYLDTLKPTLNSAPHANASFPNLGATGVVRDEMFKQIASLAHQGRVFTEATLDLHRLNMTGKQFSLETRAKMSATKLGKTTVQITNHDTSEVTAFTTKSAAATHLGISVRTLGRWASDSTAIHVTKSNSRVSVSIISI
jgi:group I intron endonuclease